MLICLETIKFLRHQLIGHLTGSWEAGHIDVAFLLSGVNLNPVLLNKPN